MAMEQVIRWREKKSKLKKHSIGLLDIERRSAGGFGLKVRTKVESVASFEIAPYPIGKLVFYPHRDKKLGMVDGEIVII